MSVPTPEPDRPFRVDSPVEQVSGIVPDAIPDDLLASPQPLMLKGLVAEWPSVAAGREGADSMLAYLRRFGRDRDILYFRLRPESGGRCFYNADLSGFNFDRVTARLPEVLDQLGNRDAEATGSPLYVGSTAVGEYFPGFREENDLGIGALAPLVSLWFGHRSRIAAHFDVPQNIACVVAGRRRFTLFPPEQVANLYVGPLDFNPAGQAISLVAFADPDFERFPRFRDALDAALVADLEPGDALLLPSMWWHHVESLEAFNVLVNYWWRARDGVSGNPLNALIHALMSIRGLPEAQREAWRSLFDYYVFRDDGTHCEHIPEQRRGILGRMDREMLRQLRAMLRNKLAG